MDTLFCGYGVSNALLQFQDDLFNLANQEDSLYEILDYRVDAFDALLVPKQPWLQDSIWRDKVLIIHEQFIFLAYRRS